MNRHSSISSIIILVLIMLPVIAVAQRIDCAVQKIDDRAFRIMSPADIVSKRIEIIRAIWNTDRLPDRSDVMVSKNVLSPLPASAAVSRVDKIEIPTHIPVVGNAELLKDLAYLFVPVKRNKRLVVLHHGHGCSFKDAQLGDKGPMLEETIIGLLQKGYDVLAVFMPLVSESGCNLDHCALINTNLGLPDARPTFGLRLFLEPTIVCLNYLLNRNAYKNVDMIGLSGGGWTTNLVTAIDTRIQYSFPVAGSEPLYYRWGDFFGDIEQYLPEFYRDIAGYPDLYVLGAYGAGRKQVQILNRGDNCCFGQRQHDPRRNYQEDLRTYEKTVKDKLISLAAGGHFYLSIDTVTHIHQISADVLDKVILPELNAQGSDLRPQPDTYRLSSPDGKLTIEVYLGDTLKWSLQNVNDQVLQPSEIGLSLVNGKMLGKKAVLRKINRTGIDRVLTSPLYKKSTVEDHCNELTLTFRGDYGLIFRAYNDGVAYRFFTSRQGELVIRNEMASFNFPSDYSGYFCINGAYPIPADRYTSYFEALYRKIQISRFPKDTLAFLPALIDLEKEKKLAILEADLEDYPGMFLQPEPNIPYCLQGSFAGFPIKEILSQNGLDSKVDGRENYIARVNGKHQFPWRVLVLSNSDRELLNNDMVQKLAPPSGVPDISWIRPGKVAWDWWSDLNISRVNFEAGVNTETYKYYVDFAADNKLEYINLDEGWSNDTNLLEISPAINLDSIIAYGKTRNVGVILWSTMYAASKNTESLFAHFSKMGIKGFKIDFVDRDDQRMVQRVYEVAGIAAKNKLVLDYHGMFKPAGLQRAYPNVLNCEGVRGLEYCKGSNITSVPEYDVQIPFIRMLAGPMDYTPGAMRNASRSSFRSIPSMPMSQGTRCHQLAMYVLYEGPLQMLADNPTAYRRDSLCTRFIAAFPTVFDETIAIDGAIGEFAVIARRKGNTWYIGALNNWTTRDLEVPLDFLGEGSFDAEIFGDGVNAERDGTDYVRSRVSVQSHSLCHVHLTAGGGWAAILNKN